ncbi:MAG: FAD-dependent oxidoreductase [Agathobacter sp.]|nr:FAD-dependent oxidoreductase [Agathobacter sp.]
MKSLWSQTTQLESRETLSADLRVQNVVIGAGITGILIAYLLQDKGLDVLVLEANEVASGQTRNTTAKITSQHGLIYHDMIKNTGMERAKGYAQANEAAIHIYKKIITKEGIACHYEELPSFLYTQKEEGVEKLRKEVKAARACGIQAEYVRGDGITELPFGVMGAVRFEHQAQFHPLEFIQTLAEKLTIYEHTRVVEVDEHFVITDKHVIVAENVIFATHYPFPIVPGYYFLRQHQSRSYALVLKGEGVPQKLSGMYYGIDRDGLSFRCCEGNLILGGGSHRTGKKQAKTEGFCGLRKQAKEYYPSAEETAFWAAQDCMPHDGIPFIGKFSIQHDNWYVATGFQKWGMSTAMVAAMIICDAIMGRENPWAKVFSPQRFLVKAGYKHFLIDAWESVAGLTRGVFKKKNQKCSHVGCALHWNEEEESWDCPCHGSRYTKSGDVMDGPAQDGIK